VESSELSAPPRATARASAKLAAESKEVQEARELKQAKIRAWLNQKDDELQERRQAEQQEARQSTEEKAQKEKRRVAREASELQKKLCRVQAAARKKQELELEVQRAVSGGDVRTTARCKVAMASALVAYGNPRPASAMSRAR
jgi:Skp family chaperone for outer membrane proteins